MTSDDELKPCPFCGGKNVVIGYVRDGRQVHCHNCGASSPPVFHGRNDQPTAEERAITVWNTRHAANTIETQAKQIDKLETNLFHISDALLTGTNDHTGMPEEICRRFDKSLEQEAQIEELVGALRAMTPLASLFSVGHIKEHELEPHIEQAKEILAKHNKGK